MQMVMRLTEELQRVLMVEANRAARDSGWQQRLRNLRGDTWVQGLVFGCLAHPLPTLEQLAQTMAACGTPVSPQALDQRFNPAAAKCLEQVLARMVQQTVATKPAVSNLLARFTEVRIIDSTTIPLPGVLSDHWKGCRGRTQKVTGSAIKFQVGLELRTGRLLGPHAEAGCASDQKSCLQTEPLPEGALEIADLGYFELDKFARKSCCKTAPISLANTSQRIRHGLALRDWSIRPSDFHCLKNNSICPRHRPKTRISVALANSLGILVR
jgi:hypothetical protein